jgi:hypothetical protein
MDLLPFVALGWLCLGVIAASVLRARRSASFEALGRVSSLADNDLPPSRRRRPGSHRRAAGRRVRARRSMAPHP